MDSKIAEADKAHAVCIPFPIQSHIKAMLKFAKLLHGKDFHITFVNTEFNHQRFLKSGGPKSLDGLPDFQFKTIPDSLPPSDSNATQDIDALSESLMENFLAPFSDILLELNTTATSSNNPPVTCIIADGFLAFTHTAASELGIPILVLFTVSACSLMGFMQFPRLRDKGLTPLKDESFLTNGFLDTVIDWILGMRDI
ncbi:7-deoxyloganetin glucosyltransferase-like [Corylus avellana]|uniref:7-deoxyloganetin glucosyltransferase-like n=1 Tax=Corylus avellana TaxID=13451 RepID=UPI001E236B98|nr:7-deoxyloganetin glucosyltransferase-like [Corylus avellana]